MLRVFREPLAQFLLVGALIFAAYQWFGRQPDARRIVVSAATLAALREEQKHLTGREPTADEERALIDRWIDNEVLVREALARGLDRDDVIVRRRLVQKMQFLAEDTEPIPEPTEEELRDFLRENTARYAVPERVSFVHVFASRSNGTHDAAARIERWRGELAAGADPATVGEPFARGRGFRKRSRAEVDEVFGSEFGTALFAQPPGEWLGPIASSFGLHLVRVGEREPARSPPLEEIRGRVRNDWREARREAANRAALRRLREGYRVEIQRSS